MKLRSLTQHPPGDFQVLIPQIGMEKPEKGSYGHCKTFFRGVIRKNPFLAKKHGWLDTDEYAGWYVEDQNAARCVAHGWITFVVDGTGHPPEAIPQAQKKTSNQAGDVAHAAGANTFAGHVRKASAGIGAVVSWLGDSLEPVAQEIADKRAWVCAVRDNGEGCPKNSSSIALKKLREARGETGNPLDWFQRIDASVAQAVKVLAEVMNDLKLKTPHDSKLGSCLGCDCDLRTKMWPKLDHILKNTSDEVRKDLDPACWIFTESKHETATD